MRILFVDDDPDTRALARRAVMQEFPDGEAVEASDRETLARALAAGAVNVLVADYDLKWIDGFEVFALTREAHPGCVAVMFTGTGSEELAVRAIKAGFDDYVVKAPGQLKRLAASVRLAFERQAERTMLRDNRELMRRELYHRLHNNLQLVVSLMALTLRGIVDAEARREVRDLMRRIQSLSLLQERFYRSDDLRRIDIGAFAAALADDRRDALPGVTVEARIDPLTVSVDRAVPLGLIVNEMLMMHVAAADAAQPDAASPGHLSVELTHADGRVAFAVRARAMEAAPTRAGLGLDLVKRLAEQIEGEVTQATDGDVVETRLLFAE